MKKLLLLLLLAGVVSASAEVIIKKYEDDLILIADVKGSCTGTVTNALLTDGSVPMQADLNVGGFGVTNAILVRAGYFESTDSAKTNVFAGSVAEGRETVASGLYSHAEGRETVASGYRTHAEGSATVASGDSSHAEGRLTTASGIYSHAEGRSTVASGAESHAEGYFTTASGDYSHAEGRETVASGYYSHAAGYNANATNFNTYVWSDGTITSSITNKEFTVYASNGIRLLGGEISGNGGGLTNLQSEADLQTILNNGNTATNTIEIGNNAGTNILAGDFRAGNGAQEIRFDADGFAVIDAITSNIEFFVEYVAPGEWRVDARGNLVTNALAYGYDDGTTVRGRLVTAQNKLGGYYGSGDPWLSYLRPVDVNGDSVGAPLLFDGFDDWGRPAYVQTDNPWHQCTYWPGAERWGYGDPFDSYTNQSISVPAPYGPYVKAGTNDVYVEFVSGEEVGLANTINYIDSTHMISTEGAPVIQAGGTSILWRAGSGVVVDNTTDPHNPVRTFVTRADQIVVITNVATDPVTFYKVDSNGDISQYLDRCADLRDKFLIGYSLHMGGQAVVAYSVTPPAQSVALSIDDMASAVGRINTEGNVFGAGGANLTVSKTEGEMFSFGSSTLSNPKSPNNPQQAALNPVMFTLVCRDGEGGFNLSAPTTNIVPGLYDDGTVTSGAPNGTLGNNKYSAMRFYVTPGNITYVHYGQAVYNSMDVAIASWANEDFVSHPSLRDALGRCVLIVEGTATDLNVDDDALFKEASKFGFISGGGGGGGVSHWTQSGEFLETAIPGTSLRLDGDIQFTTNTFSIGTTNIPLGQLNVSNVNLVGSSISLNGTDILKENYLALGDAALEHENRTHDPVYLSGQTGLDDVSSSGVYDQDGNAVFQIKIQATGSPDSFEWRKATSGGYTGPVAMTGSAQLLTNGISILWTNTTGHTLNDEWEMNVGHEVHISEPLHVTGDVTTDGDLVVAGALRSLSPVRIQEGIDILCDKETDRAKISTSCQAMDFIVGGNTNVVVSTNQVQTLGLLVQEQLITMADPLLVASGTNTSVFLMRSSSGSFLRFTDGVDFWDYFSGAGTPEGNQLGNTGSFYSDTGNGDLYVKTTDTVNTGWERSAKSSEIEEVSSEGLVLAMSFNSDSIDGTTVLDASGLNHHATVTSFPIWDATGGFNGGGSYDFDGTDDEISTGAIPELNGSGVFTASFWANADANTGDDIAFTIRNGASGDNLFVIYPCDLTGGNGVRVYWGLTGDIINENGVDRTGAWHHYTFVSRSTTDHEMFVDGVSIGTSTASETLHATVTDIDIGAWNGAQPFAGLLDEVKVFSRALSADEVAQLYHQRAESRPSFVSQKDVYVDSDGNVGAGSTNPRSKFHIRANPPGTVGSHPAGQLIIQSMGTSDNSVVAITGYASDAQGNPYQRLYYIGGQSSGNKDFIILSDLPGKMYFGVNGAVEMTIATNGYVGIGTTSPGSLLNIYGAATQQHADNLNASITVMDDEATIVQGEGTGIVLGGRYGSDVNVLAGGMDVYKESTNVNNYGFALRLFSRKHGAEVMEKMRITGEGNVGIGTATPDAKLEVAGDAIAQRFATKLWDVAGGHFETAATGIEYYSPDQHGEIYGIVYRQYFGATLPSSLTSGSNVTKLLDFCVEFKFSGSGDRSIAHGSTPAYGSGDSRIRIVLSGSSGAGNLSWSNDTYVPLTGWVDYTK